MVTGFGQPSDATQEVFTFIKMRKSKYPSGTVFEVSADNPQMFSVEDIKRYIELDNLICLSKQKRAEYISIRRSLAKTVDCPDARVDVKGETLVITLY